MNDNEPSNGNPFVAGTAGHPTPAMNPSPAHPAGIATGIGPSGHESAGHRGAPARGTPFRSMLAEWKIVAAVALALALLAWVWAVVQPDRYRASALVAVTPAAGLDPENGIRGVDTLERRTLVASVAAIAGAPLTRRRALAGIVPSTAQDDYTIDAVVLPNTNLLEVRVEGTDHARVAAVANRIPDLLAAHTQAIYRYYGIAVVSPASPADEPFEPRTGRITAAALLLGLAAGGFAAQRVALRRAAAAGR